MACGLDTLVKRLDAPVKRIDCVVILLAAGGTSGSSSEDGNCMSLNCSAGYDFVSVILISFLAFLPFSRPSSSGP